MDESILIYVNLFPQIKECSRVLEPCREWMPALSGPKIGAPSRGRKIADLVGQRSGSSQNSRSSLIEGKVKPYARTAMVLGSRGSVGRQPVSAQQMVHNEIDTGHND